MVSHSWFPFWYNAHRLLKSSRKRNGQRRMGGFGGAVDIHATSPTICLPRSRWMYQDLSNDHRMGHHGVSARARKTDDTVSADPESTCTESRNSAFAGRLKVGIFVDFEVTVGYNPLLTSGRTVPAIVSTPSSPLPDNRDRRLHEWRDAKQTAERDK